ncbi:limbin-like [Carcharodon carcharias]|uniref:limbin-like n=1 Tax=Carcharodon carcharias TaxID=13397 RepID=UPI001B7F22B2|nr:limbin-like [Carcharodon carcharias]
MWIAQVPQCTMSFSSSFLLLTAFTHTVHSRETASIQHPLMNIFKLSPPLSLMKATTVKEFRGPTSSFDFQQQLNRVLGCGCRTHLDMPVAAGIDHSAAVLGQDLIVKVGDSVAYCLEDRSSPPLQHRLTADSLGFILYDDAYTQSVIELKIMSQKQQHHPLTSAASGSMWSQSVFFSLVSWTEPIESLIKEILSQSPPKHRNIESMADPSPFNLTFQKCAEVTGKNESQIVTVRLIISNLAVQSTFNISQLTIRDTIHGLSIQSNMGRETEIGFQTYTKEFLQAGEYYIINYTAVLNAGEPQDWRTISLPAYLSFSNGSQDGHIQIDPLVADFTMTRKAVIQVSPDHGTHSLGFIVAFIVSFTLVCSILIIVHVRRVRYPPLPQVERNQSDSVCVLISDGAEQLKEKLRLEEKVIDILVLEDPQNMTQAFNDLHVLNTIHVDTDVEYYRKRMNIDAIVLLLRNFKPDGFLLEERLNTVLRGQFEEMESRLCMQHDGVLAALAAQSNQESREKMEDLYGRQRQEEEEAELLIQNMDEEVVSQFRKDLEQLHTLEQKRLKYSLLVAQQEASGNAQRELVVRLRQVFQTIIFSQLKEVTRQEEFVATSASQLLHENWHIQFQLEKLMDQQLAFQRKILDEGLAHRKNLANRIQRRVNHGRNLLNTAALHIAGFANQVKNTGYLTDSQMESLLEMVQQEILVVKQKFDEVMDREKKIIHYKLISERREHLVRKIHEQEYQQKQLASLLNTSGERRFDHNKYLMDCHDLLNNQRAELGELVEKLDEDAVDQLETLHMQLTENTSLKIKKIHAEFVQGLVSLGVPKDYLRQMAEDQDEEVNTQHEKQEENDKRKSNESLEKVREELSKRLRSEIEEQKFVQHWNQLVFQNIMISPLVLSEEEIQRIMLSYLDNFCQMYNSLALPKLRERSRVQACLTDWRNAKIRKFEQQRKKRDKLKTKELGHGDQIKLAALQERTRVKIKLHEEEEKRDAEEMSVVCTELLHQRANQMKDLEESLGTCMASVQLCKAEKQVSALEIHTAILNLQTLLLEELSTAGSVSMSECTQTVQAHIHELEQLVRLHSDTLQHELAIQSELIEQNSWTLTQSRHPIEGDTAQSSSQMYICLKQAMFKYKDLMEAESQRLRDEARNNQLLEDVKWQLLIKMMQSLQDQEMKLAAYLMQRLKVPMTVFQTLLNLLLPNATEKELTLVVNGIYPERILSSKINEDNVDEQGKRRLQRPKMSLDLKVRNKLIGEYLESMHTPCRKKRSILKRKRLQLMKQVSFSHSHGSSEFLPVEVGDHPEPINEALGEVLNMPDTGEKVFMFRIKEEVPCSSEHQPKKRKKRNFLNFKRSAVANLDEL